MKRSSRGNINLVMADVRHPSTNRKKPHRVRRIDKKHIIWGISVIIITVLVAIFVLDLGGGARLVFQKFKDLSWSIQHFNEGTDYFSILDSLEDELGGLDKKAKVLSAIPKLKAIPEVISGLRDIVVTIRELGADMEVIGGGGLQLAFNGGGEQLLEILGNMRARLARLRETSEVILVKAKEFGVERDDLDLLSEDLAKAEDSLGSIVSFLGSDSPRRLILLFENPSELRPNGGFAGSYGEVLLEKGNIRSLEVNDIYYPDKFLSLKVVPPIQLQTVTTNWGARDTGWFLDFSKSSENLLEYLESSSIYSEENITFDGVIALNVRVIGDLLRVAGPIEIPEYNLVLDHKNFLSELQREVEANKVPGENPKKVLSFAAPKLIEALGNTGQNGGNILDIFVSRARNKDIQMYFRDESMQSLVRNFSLDGGIYQEPDGFVGDYLALVNTNIAGGKTDVFVEQVAVLNSEIGPDGSIVNNLSITRSHKGQNEVDPWYNHINQNFFKIFVRPGTILEHLEGGEPKTIIPKINYLQSGYVADLDVAEVENTLTVLQPLPGTYAEQYLENGKRVFATWFNVSPGESKALRVKYSPPAIPLSERQIFTFVLDKQSGSEMDFEYAILAPAGYHWRESNSDIFRYRTDSLPVRLELELNLEKNT